MGGRGNERERERGNGDIENMRDRERGRERIRKERVNYWDIGRDKEWEGEEMRERGNKDRVKLGEKGVRGKGEEIRELVWEMHWKESKCGREKKNRRERGGTTEGEGMVKRDRIIDSGSKRRIGRERGQRIRSK